MAKLDAPGRNFATAVLSSVFNREQFKNLLKKQHEIEAEDENKHAAHSCNTEIMSDNIRDEVDMSSFEQKMIIIQNAPPSNLDIFSDAERKLAHSQEQTEFPCLTINPGRSIKTKNNLIVAPSTENLQNLKHDVGKIASSVQEINDNSNGCTLRHVFIFIFYR